MSLSYIPNLSLVSLRQQPDFYLTERNVARWQTLLQAVPGAFHGVNLSVPLQTVYWVQSYHPLVTHRVPFLPFVLDYLPQVLYTWATHVKPNNMSQEEVAFQPLAILEYCVQDNVSFLEIFEKCVEYLQQAGDEQA